MAQTIDVGLKDLTVLTLESRRATEMAELIRRHGGTPVVAPALREVAVDDNRDAFAFLDRLGRGTIDIVILLTGVGTRTLVTAVESRCSREHFADLLRRCTLVARGPKPVAALRELGLTASINVPPPNTWREILVALDGTLPLHGTRVAVQEYGAANPEFLAALRARAAEVIAVPVYRWALPDNLEPLRAAIAALLAGRIDIALFTSATQVDHLVLVAEREGVDDVRLRQAFARVLIASIGPVCSDTLRRHGLAPDLEPAQAKMGHLVATIAERGRERLAAKRTA